MRLSWNEIRARAAAFAEEWSDAHYEKGESQSFYNDFFHIFGVKRRSVAVYERRVQKLDNSSGFIDLFMPKVLLVEQKSAGRDLARAHIQAEDYFLAIPEAERPCYLLACDFQTFDLRDLETGETLSFELAELPHHIEKFGFILGVKQHTFRDQDPVNIDAAELMGHLHDALEDAGFTGEDLERFLVRIMFCLFADDTGVFESRNLFLDFIEQRTAEDGSDLGGKLQELFQTLDTPEDRRYRNLDEDLAAFPYINGELFAGSTRIPSFNTVMREALIEASRFDWSPISPAIFGSLFQSVMDREERREHGGHYTTERNILKVIGPLFMDDLWAEFDRVKALKRGQNKALATLHDQLAKLNFFDPACGCGNFLIIAYRELRRLEIAILTELLGREKRRFDVAQLSLIDVDQFYGIEIGEFAVEIARAAMWMMDHIMNNELSLAFGRNFARIPLTTAPHIIHGDALEIDWAEVIPPATCSYILSNPPYRGHQYRNPEQQSGMHRVWGRSGQVNRLDYVTCWFKLAVEFASRNRDLRIAFVATNSISQGEQAGILWPVLFGNGAHIFFAHRTFAWGSEARGRAAVHCVIVGLSLEEPRTCRLFDYHDVRGDAFAVDAAQINGYLIDGPQITIPARTPPPLDFPRALQGSKPQDGARLRRPEGGYVTRSNLILNAGERELFLARAPEAEKWLRPFVGGNELISGNWRWCLWLKEADPSEIRSCPEVMDRLNRVREGRLQSPTKAFRDFADFPTLFAQDRQPNEQYIAIPEVSSETRPYIPIAVLPPNVIASNKLLTIAGGKRWLFAALISAMHMGWMRTICGRLESRYSYAPTIYNTFPWPNLTERAKAKLSSTGEAIVEARAAHPNASLADLYDPEAMPANLRRAHRENDRAMDQLYRRKPFESERERVEHLFMLYEQGETPLMPRKKQARRR